CEDFSEKSGLNVDFTCAGMDVLKLDNTTNINIYRLVQEGLNNIRKHADTLRATIKLISAYPNIILTIEDDGKGFDVEERLATMNHKKRMGLQSMRERAMLLGGKIAIQSQPGKGTKIVVKVPCTNK
ncbi:MAG: sensor histidine kinase, partial [Proteobacteria bacterium]|nr:sensor histidine kinase [Pseudomonadota bacterium]